MQVCVWACVWVCEWVCVWVYVWACVWVCAYEYSCPCESSLLELEFQVVVRHFIGNLNLDPLEERHILLAAKPSLQFSDSLCILPSPWATGSKCGEETFE